MFRHGMVGALLLVAGLPSGLAAAECAGKLTEETWMARY